MKSATTRFILNPDLESIEKSINLESLSDTKYIQSQFDQLTTIKRSNPNSLIDLLYYAYANHQPVKLKPDDIWIQFMSQFALNVNSEPEFYRNIFADKNNLNGQTEISIEYNTPNIKDVPIDDFINQIMSVLKTKVNAGSDLVANLQADFSTSTQFTKLVSNIIFMYTVEKYFSYKMILSCGIPFIDLAGTTADWILLLKKIQLVTDIAHPGIKPWCETAIQTIKSIIKAMDNPTDSDNIKFMSKIFYDERCGSGSQRHILGWILSFFLYDKKLKKVVHNNIFPDDYPECRIKCKIMCENKFDNTNENYELHGGFYGFNKIDNCLELITGYHLQKPAFIGWTLDRVETQPESIKFDQTTYTQIKYNSKFIHEFYHGSAIDAKFCKWESINNTKYDFDNLQIYYLNGRLQFVLLHRHDPTKWICAIEAMLINGTIKDCGDGWSLISLARIEKAYTKIYPNY